jgi:hypothetical protein
MIRVTVAPVGAQTGSTGGATKAGSAPPGAAAPAAAESEAE